MGLARIERPVKDKIIKQMAIKESEGRRSRLRR